MPNANVEPLFRPLTLGKCVLANRIVMAPMTRLSAPDGIPGSANAHYYARRAEGGVGLILTEGTVVERPSSRNHADIPVFFGADALRGWGAVANAVHAAGGRIGPQLWHTGAVGTLRNDWAPKEPQESPSGLNAPGEFRGAAMTDAAIADTIAAFADAARNAVDLGFDVIELHGAHGYLIDQFFWQATNLRTDRYGGTTIGERTRFAADIIKAVRAATGPDIPVIIRLSQWKQQDYSARNAFSPDQMLQWLAPLVDAGANVLHCSQRRFWEPEFPELDGAEGLNFAGWAKKLTGLPSITVGSVGLSGEFLGAFRGKDAETAAIDGLVERLDRGEFDLVGVGRALIAEPAWAAKVRSGDTAGLRGFSAAMLETLD